MEIHYISPLEVFMATTKELLTSGNRFEFREKIYKFLSYCPSPSIEMTSEDGEIFSFGINGQIADEFILLSHNQLL
jgi:hypothetical protein